MTRSVILREWRRSATTEGSPLTESYSVPRASSHLHDLLSKSRAVPVSLRSAQRDVAQGGRSTS